MVEEKKVKCPWGCKEEIEQKKYSKHLLKIHYKKVKKKLLGPFPTGVKEEE